MATKKYVSLEKLGLYDAKIKALIGTKDAETLAAAKAHAEGLASNYDVAGAAATVQGKLDEEVTRAKAKEDEIAAAAAAADAKAVAAQGEVDALEVVVGTLPEGSASVIEYINKKTEGIATDAALAELQEAVEAAQGAIDAIEADYLVETDKTELAGDIADVQAAVDAEVTRAKAAEEANAAAIKVIADDYLKAEDKTELANAISAEAQRAGGVEEGLAARIKAVEDDHLVTADKEALQNQINTIMNNPDAEGAINSINEFTQYVTNHGTIADGFRTDIDKNKEDIAAMDTAYKAADSALAGRLDTLEAIDHEAYVAADTALKNELTTEIGKKADASVVTTQGEAITALQGEDTAIKGRLDAIETQLGDGEGSVTEQIGTAKQEAIDAAAENAETKANAAQAAAIAKAEELNTAMDERMDVVEAKAHEHANKALLDTYTQTEANLADAVAKKHEHSNLSVLEGITAAKVTEWDKVSGKAEQTALQAEIDRATAAESALGARIDEFVECSETDINNLFNV